MSTNHSYSPVLIALLMMILLLMFPWVFDARSFHLSMALKVFAWGMIVFVVLVWLAPFLIG